MRDGTSSYEAIKRLLDTAPDLATCRLDDPDVQMWLARAARIVDEVGQGIDRIQFRSAMNYLGGALRDQNARMIMTILYRALGRAEPSVRISGAFIPHGDLFEAFVQIAAVFQSARSDVFVVDPYLSEKVLQDYGKSAPEGTTLRLLRARNKHSATIEPALRAWMATVPQPRPLVALCLFRALDLEGLGSCFRPVGGLGVRRS